MFSDLWDCDKVLASSFLAAFISIITLYPTGPELHAIPSKSLISSGPLCSALVMPSTAFINIFVENSEKPTFIAKYKYYY
jgi:hypothetical protein